MDKKTLEISVDGESKGKVNIVTGRNYLQVTATEGILQNGNYIFTQDEIKEMLRKKLTKQYEGRIVKIKYQD